jgi:hypothetical protein
VKQVPRWSARQTTVAPQLYTDQDKKSPADASPDGVYPDEKRVPLCPKFNAIAFDLLTALVDSWTLWANVAGSDELGRLWRTTSLRTSHRQAPRSDVPAWR